MSEEERQHKPPAEPGSFRYEIWNPIVQLLNGSGENSTSPVTRHTEESSRTAYAESNSRILTSSNPSDTEKDNIERHDAVEGASDEHGRRSELPGFEQGTQMAYIQDAMALIQDAVVHIQEGLAHIQNIVESKDGKTPSDVEKAVRVDTNDSLAAVRTVSRVPGNSTYYEKDGLRTMGDGVDHIHEEPVRRASSANA